MIDLCFSFTSLLQISRAHTSVNCLWYFPTIVPVSFLSHSSWFGFQNGEKHEMHKRSLFFTGSGCCAFEQLTFLHNWYGNGLLLFSKASICLCVLMCTTRKGLGRYILQIYNFFTLNILQWYILFTFLTSYSPWTTFRFMHWYISQQQVLGDFGLVTSWD